ncbi:sulfite exporter TauE/SafE family protein [Puia sp. P3]|uniref:sulfite exporter TauE/SafE family protein n=1 Tax=Puia sp. P3 TaxID=3423952 RepID=UPI003D67A0AC
MWVLSAFLLGLVSSMHCVGMCGPLVLSLPLQGFSGIRRRAAVFGYHLGRIGVYGVMGVAAGLLGRSVRLAGFQQALSIFAGVGILFVAAGRKGVRMPGLFSLAARLWRWESAVKFLVLGMANGLLPCGMVYLALAAAVSLSDVWDAVAFMVFYGLGTLPLLLGVSYFGRYIGVSVRGRMRKVFPLVVASVGVLLILRGLGIGIPFVSPVLPAGPRDVILCH